MGITSSWSKLLHLRILVWEPEVHFLDHGSGSQSSEGELDFGKAPNIIRREIR